jgi:hypothetical protein
MVLGQSAAVAASLAIDQRQPVQQVDVKKIQEILKVNPLMDASEPEILVDNDDSAVTTEGDWQRKTSEPSQGYTGNYGPSMLIAVDHTSKRAVKFNPIIRKAGQYHLYSYFPKVPRASANTRYLVYDGKSEKTVDVQSASVLVEGQTSGEWVSLGTYHLPKGRQSYVSVTNEDADGIIVADAVLFVPVKK